MNRTLSAMILLQLVGGCRPKDKSPAVDPTYTRDVAPILDARCLSCHAAGGIAPFSLEGYEAVSILADAVADAVVNRRMPPGQANNDCQTYVFDPALTDDEIETIASWAEAGAKEGDSADAVDTPVAEDPEALDRVDLEVQMPEAYAPQTLPDDYRCFTADWPADEETYVTGFGVVPGVPEIVHHVIIYIIPPADRAYYEERDAAEDGAGYACFGGPGAPSVTTRPQWLGGWVPGQTGRNMPAGTGIAVEPGSMLIVETHYYVGDSLDVTPDQSTVVLKIDDAVEHEGITQPFADPNWVLGGTMVIPAGAEDVSFSYTKELTSGVILHDIGMHMHTRGSSGTIVVEDPDGTETCALQIDDWDFHWQRSFRLKETLTLAEGSTMTVTCNFSNTSSKDITWGESTDDEMCLGITYLSYQD